MRASVREWVSETIFCLITVNKRASVSECARVFPIIAHMHRERENNCELTPVYHNQNPHRHTKETRRAVPSRREQDIITAGDCVELGETGPERGSVHPLLQTVTV